MNIYIYMQNHYTTAFSHSCPTRGAETTHIIHIKNHSVLPMVLTQSHFAMSRSMSRSYCVTVPLYSYFFRFYDFIKDTFTFNKKTYTNELLYSSPPKGNETKRIMEGEHHSILPMVLIQRRFAMSRSYHRRILLHAFFYRIL